MTTRPRSVSRAATPTSANLTLTAETDSTLSASPAITALGDAIAQLQNNGNDVADPERDQQGWKQRNDQHVGRPERDRGRS